MDIPVIDLHADTYFKRNILKKIPFMQNSYLKQKDGTFSKIFSDFMVSDENLKKGNVKVQTQSLFFYGNINEDPLHTGLQTINTILKDVKKENYFKADSLKSIEDNFENDKTGILISIEGLEIVKNDLELLNIYKELGVRMVAPSWNRALPYAGSILEDHGILEKGRELAARINELNLIFDTSHLSEKSFFDFHEIIKTPLIASHSNIKALNNHKRNLSNDQLKILEERKSVFGINFFPDFLEAIDVGNCVKKGFESIYRIIEYLGENFSLDIIAIGSDFDGINKTYPELNNSAIFPKLADFLLKKGMEKEDIEKIFYKNVMRVFKEVL